MVIARLPDPAVNLAAFQVTFALALLVEAPVIMLLTASTALATNRASYGTLLKFTAILASVVTLVHLALGLSPLYVWLLGDVMDVAPPVASASRTAFILMAPWSAAIAFRRLWQGVLIRYDLTKRAGLTTAGRLVALGSVLVLGLATQRWPGAAVGAAALSAGVIAGMLAAWVLSRPVTAGLRAPLATDTPLTRRALLSFYTPLALTSLLLLGGGPVVSFALGHASDEVAALAVWQVVLGLVFLVRSAGYAYQEVVVALQDRSGAYEAVRSFALLLAVVLGLIMGLIAFTPLGTVWLQDVIGLSPELTAYALDVLPVVAAVPSITVAISLYRGRLVGMSATPALTIAVLASLGVLILVTFLGIQVLDARRGALVAGFAYASATCVEALVLLWQSRRRRAGPLAFAPSGA
jgi:hypothetical protein